MPGQVNNLSWWRWFYLSGLIAVSYILLCWVSHEFPFLDTNISLIWPAAGLSIAVLWRLGLRFSPAIFAGASIFNALNGLPLPLAMGIGSGNVIGAMLAVWLIRHYQLRYQLDTGRDMWLFLLIALVVDTGFTSISGVLHLSFYQMLPGQLIWDAWLVWWLGDSFGVLIFGVPLLCFNPVDWQRLKKTEFLLLQILNVLLSGVLFLSSPSLNLPITVLFLPLFLLIIVVLRQGLWSAAVSAMLMAVISIIGTSSHLGIFSQTDQLQAIFTLWTYIAALCLIVFVLVFLHTKLVQTSGHINIALEGSTLGIWDLDLRRRKVQFYGQPKEILGYNDQIMRDDLASWIKLLHPQDIESTRKAFVSHLKGETAFYQAEFRLRRQDGSWAWIFAQGRVVEWDLDGRAWRLVGSNTDVSRLKLANLEVVQLRDFYATILSKVVTGVWVTNAAHRLIFANEGLAHMVGLTVAELMDKQVLTEFPDVTLQHFRPYYYRAQQGLTPVRFEGMPMHTSAGRDVFLNGWLVPLIKDGVFDGMICTADDITQQRLFEQQMLQLAYVDQLTGLPNRAALADKAREAFANAMQQQQQLAVFYLNLDHFQHINDTMGHQTGDELLQLVAKRLTLLQQPTDILGRLGGDEFLLIKHCTDDHDLNTTAVQILQMMAEHFPVGERNLTVSPSIGIALFPKHGLSFAELLRMADIALYHAKNAGRRSFSIYTHQMSEQLQERLQLEHGMRSGLYTGQFSVAYQPVQQLSDMQIYSVEALLRWQHPQLGAISPARFIPVAEHSGFIVELGQWVLQQAIQQAARWQRQGLRLRVAVNISTVQLLHSDFLPNMLQCIQQAQLDPDLLELELTESVLAQQVERSRYLLQQIQRSGIRLALDDFGTGYSSLAYLKSFPFNKLKIDRAFVKDVLKDPDDRAIIHAMLVLGHSLGMKVVAEGVEELEQLHQLKAMAIDEIQGYLLTPALPAAELELWLARDHSLNQRPHKE